MGGKVRPKEDPVGASEPPLEPGRHERLVESCVCLPWDPLWQHRGRDSAVPAVPARGGREG